MLIKTQPNTLISRHTYTNMYYFRF